MNFLFVYSNAANIGGVQTLIARIAEGLIEEGHSVSALFFNDISQTVADFFPDKCRCLSVPEKYRTQIRFPHNCGRWLSRECGDANICVTFSKSTMHFVVSNLGSFENPPAVISYVVNEVEFTRTKKKVFNRVYSNMFYDKYFKRMLPDKNKFFMSDAIRRVHEDKLGVQFPGSRIMPLPISIQHQQVTASLRPFRLVSIGRIGAFMKTYNFNVPQIIRELHDEGLEVHWDIYGGGTSANIEKFTDIIREFGVENYITWHGELPYSKMSAALENATAFLGMGTAVLEAAMLGIPAIVAVASSSEPVCYGFLHEIPFGICGESSAYWLKRHNIKSVLSELYETTHSDYDKLVVLETHNAKQYDAKRLISLFIEYAEESRKVAVPPFPILWSVFQCLNRIRST